MSLLYIIRIINYSEILIQYILGKVLDFWWRREYQKRGAIHIHMVVWFDPQTVPSDAVCAEMPRASEMNDPFVQTLRYKTTISYII